MLEIHCLSYRNICGVLIHNQKICFLLNYKTDTSILIFSPYFFHHSIPNNYSKDNCCISHMKEFLNKHNSTIKVVYAYWTAIRGYIGLFSLFVIDYYKIFLFECCLQSCLDCWSFGLWFSWGCVTRGRSLGLFEITAKKYVG